MMGKLGNIYLVSYKDILEYYYVPIYLVYLSIHKRNFSFIWINCSCIKCINWYKNGIRLRKTVTHPTISHSVKWVIKGNQSVRVP